MDSSIKGLGRMLYYNLGMYFNNPKVLKVDENWVFPSLSLHI
jgi:hypothetical protein